jgi:hypothetical protein
MTKTLFLFAGTANCAGSKGSRGSREIFDEIATQADQMFRSGVPVQDNVDRYEVPEQFKNVTVHVPRSLRPILLDKSCGIGYLMADETAASRPAAASSSLLEKCR